MLLIYSHLKWLEDIMRNNSIPEEYLVDLFNINDESMTVIRDIDMTERFSEDFGMSNDLKIQELHVSNTSLVADMLMAFKSSTNTDLLSDEEECTFFINFLIDLGNCLENRCKFY